MTLSNSSLADAGLWRRADSRRIDIVLDRGLSGTLSIYTKRRRATFGSNVCERHLIARGECRRDAGCWISRTTEVPGIFHGGNGAG